MPQIQNIKSREFGKYHLRFLILCLTLILFYDIFRMKYFGDGMKEWSEEKTGESRDRAGRKVSF